MTTPTKPPEKSQAKRVAVLAPDGTFGTMPEDKVSTLPDGARVLGEKEVAEYEQAQAQRDAEAAADARYDALPTWKKAVGLIGGNPYAHPLAGAVSEGTFEGVTAGLGHGVVRQGIDVVAGKPSGDEYAERIDQLRAANPNAYGLGNLVGTTAGLVNPAGEAAEGFAAARLAKAGIEGASVLGRAGVTAAKLAARGAVEGAIAGGAGYAGDELLHDQPVATDKLFASTGLGAVFGVGAGAALGGGSSLLGSGLRAGRTSLARMLSNGTDSAATKEAAAATMRDVRLSTHALDAGIRERASAVESPFAFGPESVGLRPDVEASSALATEKPLTFSRSLAIDPDAGLRAAADDAGNAIHPTGKGRYSTVTERVPISDIDVPEPWDATKLPPLRAKRAAGVELDPIRLGEMDPAMRAKTGKRFAIADGIHRTNVALERGESDILAKYEVGEHPQKLNNDVFNMKRPIDVTSPGMGGRFDVKLNPDAAGPSAASDAFNVSGPRKVGLRDVLYGAEDASVLPRPIDLGAPSSVQTGSAFRAPTGSVRSKANELAFDALGATKTQARKALENISPTAEEAKLAVGDYVNRAILGPSTEGATGLRGVYRAAASGRADDLLHAIRADKAGRIATGIGDAVKGIPARVDMHTLYTKADKIGDAMVKDPTKIAGVNAFRDRVLLEMQAIKNAGKVAADGTIDAADAYYIRSELEKQAYELRKVSGAAGDAYKSFLREWDKASVQALDEAASKAGKSGVADSIRHWKREWQLASAAEEAAEGGAERVSHNNTFGIRESIAGGVGIATALTSDDPLTGVAAGLGTMIGGKILRERAAAAAAHTLMQLADRGALAGAVKRTTDQIARASKGLITPPPTRTALELAGHRPTEILSTSKLRSLATSVVTRVAAFQHDPEAFVDRAGHDVEHLAAHSPEFADALITKRVQAMNFLASKVPTQGDPDPLDPHPRLRLTPTEERSLGLYAWYTDKPERFFAEVAQGKLIPEGAEVAQALMPDAFGELQAATAEALTTQLSRGNRLPFRQRALLGQLLDFAAVPSQRPEHRAFLQDNVSDSNPVANDTLPANVVSHGRRRSGGGGGLAAMTSPLDALEAGGIGRRRR